MLCTKRRGGFGRRSQLTCYRLLSRFAYQRTSSAPAKAAPGKAEGDCDGQNCYPSKPIGFALIGFALEVASLVSKTEVGLSPKSLTLGVSPCCALWPERYSCS